VRRRAIPDGVITLTIYSRPGCHLCDDMKAIVERVAREDADVSVSEVDVSTAPQLEARYGLDVPVLLIDGRKVAKYRVTEAELRRILRDREGGEGKLGREG
jgi:thiol-disulfide isomerase/thioredoxin